MLHVPAITSAYSEPAATGYTRIEEDDARVQFDGTGFEQASWEWNFVTSDDVSGSYYAVSSTAGDTVGLTFDGAWAAIGFVGNSRGGEVELYQIVLFNER